MTKEQLQQLEKLLWTFLIVLRDKRDNKKIDYFTFMFEEKAVIKVRSIVKDYIKEMK